MSDRVRPFGGKKPTPSTILGVKSSNKYGALQLTLRTERKPNRLPVPSRFTLHNPLIIPNQSPHNPWTNSLIIAVLKHGCLVSSTVTFQIHTLKTKHVPIFRSTLAQCCNICKGCVFTSFSINRLPVGAVGWNIFWGEFWPCGRFAFWISSLFVNFFLGGEGGGMFC